MIDTEPIGNDGQPGLPTEGEVRTPLRADISPNPSSRGNALSTTLGLIAAATVSLSAAIAGAEEPSERKFRPPESIVQLSTQVPLLSNKFKLDGSLIFWAEEPGKSITIAYAGPRFRLNQDSWISVRIGAADQWFHDGSPAGILSVKSQIDLLHHRLMLTLQGDAHMGMGQHDLYGWQSLDVKPTTFLNIGVHGEEITNRLLAGGPHIGVATEDHALHVELQYLAGKWFPSAHGEEGQDNHAQPATGVPVEQTFRVEVTLNFDLGQAHH